jgi:hypothetical protein
MFEGGDANILLHDLPGSFSFYFGSVPRILYKTYCFPLSKSKVIGTDVMVISLIAGGCKNLVGDIYE